MFDKPDVTAPFMQVSLRYNKGAVALLGVGILIGAVGAIAFGAVGAIALVRWDNMMHTHYAPISYSPYKYIPAPLKVPRAYKDSKPLNNSCLIPNLEIPVSDKPQTFNACGFVIESTDQIWNLRDNVTEAIDKYFHDDYIDGGSWGLKLIGKTALREAVLRTMRAFPDIKIHITDCVCRGNDIDGYKCMMPDVLEGTNLGASAYGPPTGRYAKWSGMVESFVKKDPSTGQWQYWAEWGVHDEWALVQQLGLDFSKVPHPGRDLEQFHDCTPLVRYTAGGNATYDWQDMHAQQLEKGWRLRGSKGKEVYFKLR